MKLRKRMTPVRPRLELVGASEGVFRVWCEGLTPGKTYQLWGTVSDAHRPTKDPTVQAIATFEAEAEQQLVRIGFPKLAVDWRTSLRLRLELHDKEGKMLISLFCDRKTELNDGWRPVMASRYAKFRRPARSWIKLICCIAVPLLIYVLRYLFLDLSKAAPNLEVFLTLKYKDLADLCRIFALPSMYIGILEFCINFQDPWR